MSCREYDALVGSPFLIFASLALLLVVGCPSEPELEQETPIAPEDCATRALPWGEGGGDMLPGTDCISCHRVGGHANTRFTVAGTVLSSATCPQPIEGAQVLVTDAGGEELTLTTSPMGNVWTDEPLEPPFLFAVEMNGELLEMQDVVESGSCNRCHEDNTPLGFVYPP